ncbi:type B 50S ribosomal protein L31 [Candidatus Saccharibacteria bacterium]|nr:type B 50S ribosomal protein L31 [Candidatus Saccharibacteria bacterium]
MSKKELHPKDYRFVVFRDEAADFAFLTKSTAKSEETIKWTDGKEYPLVKVQISSASHPFFTGEEKIIDTEGRVDRFKARAEKAAKMKEQLANKAKKAEREIERKAKKEAELAKAALKEAEANSAE